MLDFFLDASKDASSTRIALEFIAFVLGIMSVWYAKKENIWVYPTGLVATVITAYLLYLAGYLGDMMINAYFSIMSIYGWYRWAKGKQSDDLSISRTSSKEKAIGVLLFAITILVVYGIYKFFDQPIHKDNYIDIFASGLFFTGM